MLLEPTFVNFAHHDVILHPKTMIGRLNMSTVIAKHLCCARKLSMTALKGILSRYSKHDGNENRL